MNQLSSTIDSSLAQLIATINIFCLIRLASSSKEEAQESKLCFHPLLVVCSAISCVIMYKAEH